MFDLTYPSGEVKHFSNFFPPQEIFAVFFSFSVRRKKMGKKFKKYLILGAGTSVPEVIFSGCFLNGVSLPLIFFRIFFRNFNELLDLFKNERLRRFYIYYIDLPVLITEIFVISCLIGRCFFSIVKFELFQMFVFYFHPVIENPYHTYY